MNIESPINDMSHDEIRKWLKRALNGHEQLPRFTPDESPFIAILRLEKTLKPATRDSLRDGCMRLVSDFCKDGRGETWYLDGLLSLAKAFKNPATVHILAQMSQRFPQMPELAGEIRLAVLATLVDTPPPQQPVFWENMLKQDPEKYSGLVLSGLLATNWGRAIEMLPEMPDSDEAGQATALILDLTWDELSLKHRCQFVDGILSILPRCHSRLAGPVKAWAKSKDEPTASSVHRSLRSAIGKVLGEDSAPRAISPRLCHHEAA